MHVCVHACIYACMYAYMYAYMYASMNAYVCSPTCLYVCMKALVFRLVLALFLHLHSPVLEPDLHLPLREVQSPRHLVPAVSGEVHVEEELFLQLQGLVLRVGTPLLPGGACVQPVGGGIV